VSQVTTYKEYETIYILRPDASREVTEGLASRMANVVNGAGKLQRVENWGRRRLAYTVAKHKRGIYVYMKYAGAGGVVSEVERMLGLQEAVMKYQTVKTSDLAEVADVADADVEFQHVEVDEDEVDETLAQALGLDSRGRWGSNSSDDSDDDDDGSSDDESSDDNEENEE